MTAITAKVACSRKDPAYTGTTDLAFAADYQDGRNQEWAAFTPSLSFQMNVKDSVAAHFRVGGKWTVTFEPDDAEEAS